MKPMPSSNAIACGPLFASLALCCAAKAQLLPAGTAMRAFSNRYERGSAGMNAGEQTLSNGLAWQETLIPAYLRPAIHGRHWTQQAIALDPQTGELRGTQCGKQRF